MLIEKAVLPQGASLGGALLDIHFSTPREGGSETEVRAPALSAAAFLHVLLVCAAATVR